jgi:hypothetical protein
VISKQRASAFHKFPKLPIELRLKIWSFSLGPHVLKIYPEWRAEVRQELDYLGRDKEYNVEIMTYRVCALFHVCRESRMVGLEVYQTYSYLGPSDTPLEYLHPDVNILHLSEDDIEF